MRVTWLIVASLMTLCCVLGAPQPQSQETAEQPKSPQSLKEQFQSMTDALLKERLMKIAAKAESEFQEMEAKAETLQDIFGDPDSEAPLTPEQQLLQERYQESQSGAQEATEGILRHLLLSGLLLKDTTLTPEQLLLLHSLGNGGSMFQHLADLARAKVMIENGELFIYNLLKNRTPGHRLVKLTDLALIYQYQEAMSQSMRRSRFLLMMHLSGMVGPMNPDMISEEDKKLAAAMLYRMKKQQNQMWDIEEAIMLKRFMDGKLTLEEAALAYMQMMEVMGSDLQTVVKNMIRINMMNGSGMAMMNNGTWMKGWLNNTEFMTVSDTERNNEIWELYKLRYDRRYSREEERLRRRIFEKKVAEVVMHNIDAKLDLALFTMALNNRSDWTSKELSMSKGYNKTMIITGLETQKEDIVEGEAARPSLPAMPDYTNTVDKTSLPASVNWTNTSWVGPVQNQHQCGACWAFSAAGALEAQYYNKTQTFVTMSEQNLVDCTYYLGNLGCDGGNVELAFDYIMTVGIDSYSSYPYTARANNGVCKYNPANSVTQNTGGWRLIPSGDELALQQAVALVGPVSAAIDAGLSSFDSYAGGIYSPADCSTTELDHAILVVGYGTQDDVDYWLIKNQWGTDWGIDGYMMMERGVNMCGIATAALFPVIN